MTARDDMGSYRSGSDSVSVAPGVPTDRVRWGPILAGTFAAFTALAVLSTLGAAIGLSAYDPGDNPRNYAIGAGVWGIITMLLAFGFGGWFAARSAAVRGTNNGLMNGFMVAGLGIPLLLFMLGSAGGLLGHAMASNRDVLNTMNSNGGNAQQASATIRGNGGDGVSANFNTGGSNNNANVTTEDARRASSRTAWGTLASFVLAIGAASIAGLMGARDDRRNYLATGGTTGTTTGGGSSL